MPRACEASRGSGQSGAARVCALFASAILFLSLSACAARTNRAPDDLSTTTLVKIALLNDPQVGALRLDVTTVKGEVTLSGAVKSQADEAAALAVARRVHGVRRVKSELKVAGSSLSPLQV